MNYETAVRVHLKIRQQGEVIQDPVVSRDSGKIVRYRTKKNPWVAVRDQAQAASAVFLFGI